MHSVRREQHEGQSELALQWPQRLQRRQGRPWFAIVPAIWSHQFSHHRHEGRGGAEKLFDVLHQQSPLVVQIGQRHHRHRV